jgi:hypothetical protein
MAGHLWHGSHGLALFNTFGMMRLGFIQQHLLMGTFFFDTARLGFIQQLWHGTTRHGLALYNTFAMAWLGFIQQLWHGMIMAWL